VLVCLGVAGQAAWQMHQALQWNQRLLALAAEPVVDAAAAREAARAAAEQAAAQAARAASRNEARRETRVAPVWQDEVASAAEAAGSAASAAVVAEPQVPAWLADGIPPAWRFAQALQLARAGDLDAALARYRSVHDDPQLGNAARYNSANTLLREAMRLAGTAAPGQALVMFELAKEGYRSVLRRDPQFWAARYNLERALTLQPDGAAVESASAERGERAATTMRSVSRGLP
jgi:mxaK protein